jgi:hypothetical protein
MVEFKEQVEQLDEGKQRKCFITEVRESPAGLEEHVCGEDAPEGHAGLCR